MSWQDYVNQLIAHYMIDHAAIWGKKPGEESQWATSEGFTMTVEEVKRLAGDSNALCCCGPTIGGVKCRLIRDNSEDPNVLSMNLKSAQDEQGKTRCVCVGVTKSALVIAVGSKDSIAGTVADQVYLVVNHLRNSGF